MTISTADILLKLTKEILGAINFDNIDKWEIEGEKIPKTFFSDRLRKNKSAPINKEAVGRLVKLYQAQLGLFIMKTPIGDPTSCNYANELIEFITQITEIDLSCLKNYPSHKKNNIPRREKIVDILTIILNASIDVEFLDTEKVIEPIREIVNSYEINTTCTINEKILPVVSKKEESEKRLHLVESKGYCPVCNQQIIREDNNSVIESYDFIQIDYTKPDTPSNKIVVCKNCYEKLKNGISNEEKEKLLSIKKKLSIDSMFSENINDMVVEKEIEEVLMALGSIKSESEIIPLNYHPKKVDEKIDDDFNLCSKVRGYVVTYFNFVAEKLKDLNRENKVKYILISNEVKIVYITLAGMDYSKKEIFECMTQWLMMKTKCVDRTVCEIIIAYYVQNCEVLGEITE